MYFEATRLPAITPGPCTRAAAGRRPLVAVVRLIELGEVGRLSTRRARAEVWDKRYSCTLFTLFTLFTLLAYLNYTLRTPRRPGDQ